VISIQFTPWTPFYARKDPGTIKSWLQAIGEASKQAFSGGMGSYPPASAPGAWPNSRTGSLKGSIAIEVTESSMTIGSNMPYSIYLRTGTSKMARRKMSDDALKEGMSKSDGTLGHWVRWSRM
jgi:hypothetical protein